jgi:predicted methyltransferase
MRALIALFLLAGAVPAIAQANPLAASVASTGRPAADVALDAGRKPAEMLGLAGLKAGDRVLDVMAGQGYYTRLAAPVAGSKGAVIALMPTAYMKDPKVAAGWEALKAANPNVTVQVGPPGDATLPGSLDLTIFHLTYHDLYWESAKYEYPRMDPALFLTKLHAATRPGGRVLVVDHVGAAGVDPRVEADRTHRIDPAVVKRDFEAAGFRLVKQSDALRNPADDISKLVFDPGVRGKTDRMVWLFERPRR